MGRNTVHPRHRQSHTLPCPQLGHPLMHHCPHWRQQRVNVKHVFRNYTKIAHPLSFFFSWYIYVVIVCFVCLFCGWFGAQVAHLHVMRDATQVKGRESAREHARDVVSNARVFHQVHAVLTWKSVASATPRWPITAKSTSALETVYYFL